MSAHGRIMIPGKGLVLLARFTCALPCDVDNKVLWMQFVSDMQVPNFLLKMAIDDPGGAPLHVIENGSRRGRPYYGPHIFRQWVNTGPNRAQRRTSGSRPAGTGCTRCRDRACY